MKKKYNEMNQKCSLSMNKQIHQNITFANLAEVWLNSVKLHIKESTYSRYFHQLNKHILPYIGAYFLSQIDVNRIEKLIWYLLNYGKDKNKTGLSGKTVNDILILIKSILKFGNFDKRMDLHRIKVIKEDNNIRVLTKSSQIKLHQYLVNNIDYIKAGILLCLHTGIRIGEVCALRWENIDVDNHIMNIEYTIQRIQIVNNDEIGKKTKVIITSPKSRKSVRTIPLPLFLCNILKELQQDLHAFILTGSENYMEPRTLSNHFKKCLKKASIENYKFHSLRHTFATNYIEAGFDTKSLSEILGHSNVKITLEKYVHSTNRLKQDNIEQLFQTYCLSPET